MARVASPRREPSRPVPRSPHRSSTPEDRWRPALVALAGSLVLLPAGASPAAGQSSPAVVASDSAAPGDGGVGADAHRPNVRPTLRIRRAAGPIEIDGRMDDAGWEGAAVAADFTESFPDENARPPVATRVLVAYDDEHLYLGFVAEDDPASVRASLRDRDGIFQDDFVGVMLDTYADQTWAYEVLANPLGVQGDLRMTTAMGEDEGFDMVYETAGRLTGDGYRVEMAIPFASLRFPDREVQEWRATFLRVRPRGARAQYFWSAIERDDPCFMCQWGTLTGMEGIRPGGSLELFPSLVASQTGSLRSEEDPSAGLDNGDLTADPSLGLRYAFASGFTAEATVNPDFSQVESDVAQIDANTTFALFFPERRPFFQEGSDLFESWISTVYTRSINDPQAAVKMTARQGATSVAYIAARDEHTPLLLPFDERSFVGQAGRSVSNIVRARHTLGESSFVGAVFTDRRLEASDGSGTAFGVDGLLRLGDTWQLEAQVVGSHTAEPDDPSLTQGVNGLPFDDGRHTAAFDGESYAGHAEYLSLERGGRTYSLNFDYWAYSPTFRADNGFETRNDSRELILAQDLTFYPEGSLVSRFSPFVEVSRRWDWSGEIRESQLLFYLGGDLGGDTYAEIVYWRDPERFRGIDFDDGWGWNAYVESNFSDPVRLGFSVGGGDDIARNLATPILADAFELEVFATVKPLRNLILEPQVQYSRLTRPGEGSRIFSGYIFRNRANFQLTRELFVRLVTQYDGFSERFDVEPLITYKIDPFTQFFVGSTHRYADVGEPGAATDLVQTERQLFAKFQYLLRL